MGKKLKLKLEDLKVQSFVTGLGHEEKDKIKGGNTSPTECDGRLNYNTCGSCTYPCDCD
jgi:hypothetical protein